ncbi:hypothetical protein ARTHRO8AJ_210148 [Arthrobacter sp. 8AJ]|nr:hypothetical protein ARTHRO8AJ_210148 [Arthrobacter sp. 8AJ]
MLLFRSLSPAERPLLPSSVLLRHLCCHNGLILLLPARRHAPDTQKPLSMEGLPLSCPIIGAGG